MRARKNKDKLDKVRDKFLELNILKNNGVMDPNKDPVPQPSFQNVDQIL